MKLKSFVALLVMVAIPAIGIAGYLKIKELTGSVEEEASLADDILDPTEKDAVKAGNMMQNGKKTMARVYKVTFEGHSYIVVSNAIGSMGVTHDPDCPACNK